MKTLFKTATIFGALILLILAAAGADESALLSVVEAEKSFAATSVDRGIRESFLKFFAENSIIFAPEPKNGKKFYTYYEDKGRRLSWRPIFATIARSGELGVTTGPWELAKSKTESAPIAFGDFLSVWRKQLDGSWKVIVDVGVDHAQPGELPQQLQLLPPSGAAGTRADVDLARRTLQAADSKLADSLKQSGGDAILDVASDQVRVLRQNVLPALGRDAATSLLRADRVGTTRSFIDGGLSDAGDLAYRYGSYSSAEKNASGYFLTIWRAEANGDWKIIVDLQKKTPAM